jgi:hypothetical protein
MKIKIFFILVCIFLIQGCTTSPELSVNIDSIATKNPDQNIKYVMFSGMEKVSSDDLQFQEYSRYVENALQSKGYKKSESIENANVAIFISYGIGEPKQHQFTYSVPVYGKTGIASSNTYGTVNSYGNRANYNTSTTYTPSYGVIGATTQVGTTTTYTRFLQIDALALEPNKKTKPEKNLWKTTVTSTGTSNDLRRVMPVMVAGSSEYIASNTGKIVTIDIKENDNRVSGIKK